MVLLFVMIFLVLATSVGIICSIFFCLRFLRVEILELRDALERVVDSVGTIDISLMSWQSLKHPFSSIWSASSQWESAPL